MIPFPQALFYPFTELALAGMIVIPLSVVLLPMLKRAAFHLGLVDSPGERKPQKKAVPLLGSLPFLFSFHIGFLCLYLLSRYRLVAHECPPWLWGVLAGSSLIFLVGLLDDIFKKSFPAGGKALGQFVAAAVAAALGVRLSLFESEAVNVLFSVFWLFWLSNAMNMLDNMDGLTGVCSLVLFGCSAYLHLDRGNLWSFYLSMLCLYALAAFLFYNFPPASIYMGDSGSNFLGFVLACFSIMLLPSKPEGGQKMLEAMLFLIFFALVPLLDNLFVITRRLRAGHPIYRGDRRHLSHFLLKKGFSVYNVLFIFCLLSLFAALFSSFIFVRMVP